MKESSERLDFQITSKMTSKKNFENHIDKILKTSGRKKECCYEELSTKPFFQFLSQKTFSLTSLQK